MNSSSRPIFVGGTGRSGTTIVASILGSHPDIYMIPIEVRFIVDEGGLCDLVAGETSFDHFTGLMLGRWWLRSGPDAETRGMHKVLDRDVLLESVDELSLSLKADPLEGARRFIHQLLDPLARASGASRWVEMTPPNAARAGELLRLFPEMKLVNSVRSGKDVACSVVPLSWGPKDVVTALDWWGVRMVNAHRAAVTLSSDHLLTVRLEDLIIHDRTNTLCGLLEFCGLEPDSSVSSFFRREVTIGRSNIGRWATDVGTETREDFLRRYDSVVSDLRRTGIDV